MRGSLTRQSLLVAGVCLVADSALYLALRASVDWGWQGWALHGAIVLADLALVASVRHSGAVAIGQATLGLLEALLWAHGAGTRVAGSFGFAVATYQAGAWLRGRWAVAVFATLILGELGRHLVAGDWVVHRWPALLGLALGLVVLPWLVGRATTTRQTYLAGLAAEAELARRDERAAVRRAVAEERGAVARDLHDVISHYVSAIAMHAGVARMSLNGTGPTQAGQSLSEVESASRAAMVELRRMLDLLHGQDIDDSQRQPGLHGIGDLVDRVRAAGVAARLTLRGTPPRLPESLDVALYRIAQANPHLVTVS